MRLSYKIYNYECRKMVGMGHDRIPTDIDVVGIDEIGKKAILGERKFQNEQIDKPVYEDLMNRKGLIDRIIEEVQYMYFSLSGFSKWVVENADAEQVMIVNLKLSHGGCGRFLGLSN